MNHHRATVRIGREELPHDPLHPTDAAIGIVSSILVVVHSELHKQQVDRPRRQHIPLQPKGPRIGTR